KQFVLESTRETDRPSEPTRENPMKFITRSLLVLFALYGLIFVLGDWYLIRSGAHLPMAIIFAVLFIGVQYLIAPHIIEWILDISWCDEGAKLPQANREFIEHLCAKRG